MVAATREPLESGSVEIVVPTYNNVDQLRSCLASIGNCRTAARTVFVCVDGSTDGTIEFLASFDGNVTITVLKHADDGNHGRAATRNLALPHLTSEFVLLLDSDMRLHPDAIDAHQALLGGARNVVSLGDVRYENAGSNPWARYLGTRGAHKSRSGNRVRPLDFNTQNVAMRTQHLRQVNGFDEQFQGYGGEDTELGLRLETQCDVTIVLNRAAIATTVELKTVDEAIAQLRMYARTNLHRTRNRHPAAAAPFWTDRIDSRRLGDRLLRLAMNPATDWLADALWPRAPWPIQRQLLNYKVIRAIFSGYLEGPE